MSKPFAMPSPMLRPTDWLLLLVAAIWGGSYSAAKVATAELPVLQLMALRFGLTFLLLLPALRGVTAIPSWPKALLDTSLLGANLLAIFICETFGVSLTTASNAAFLISLCVVFTPVCERLLLGTRPGMAVYMACGLSAIGAGLLAFAHENAIRQLTWGDALMVLAAVLRGVMVCLTRRQALKFSVPAGTMTAIQMGVMAIGSMILLVMTTAQAQAQVPVWSPLPDKPSFWWAIAYLVLPCTILAMHIQNYAASRTSPSQVALLMGSEPLWGALIAVMLLRESLSLQAWMGGLLIVISAGWASRIRPQPT